MLIASQFRYHLTYTAIVPPLRGQRTPCDALLSSQVGTANSFSPYRHHLIMTSITQSPCYTKDSPLPCTLSSPILPKFHSFDNDHKMTTKPQFVTITKYFSFNTKIKKATKRPTNDHQVTTVYLSNLSKSLRNVFESHYL